MKGDFLLHNNNLEKYLAFIIMLLLVIVALLIPILAKADDDGWSGRVMPDTPLLPTPEPTPQPEWMDLYIELPDATEDEVPQITDEDLIRSVISESEEKKLAQTLYGEDRTVGDADDTMRQAAVIWSIFNRCDAWDMSVDEVITHDQYHGWYREQQHPDWAHELVRDVALRWAKEKMGEKNVGRVLPKEYLFFSNGGRHEKFRSGYRTRDYWDWSWENPYESALNFGD